jgi:hypothetical protein
MSKFTISYRSDRMGRHERATVTVRAANRFTAVRSFLKRIGKRCEVWIMSVL